MILSPFRFLPVGACQGNFEQWALSHRTGFAAPCRCCIHQSIEHFLKVLNPRSCEIVHDILTNLPIIQWTLELNDTIPKKHQPRLGETLGNMRADTRARTTTVIDPTARRHTQPWLQAGWRATPFGPTWTPQAGQEWGPMHRRGSPAKACQPGRGTQRGGVGLKLVVYLQPTLPWHPRGARLFKELARKIRG